MGRGSLWLAREEAEASYRNGGEIGTRRQKQQRGTEAHASPPLPNYTHTFTHTHTHTHTLSLSHSLTLSLSLFVPTSEIHEDLLVAQFLWRIVIVPKRTA